MRNSWIRKGVLRIVSTYTDAGQCSQARCDVRARAQRMPISSPMQIVATDRPMVSFAPSASRGSAVHTEPNWNV
jgi:hypothetical protein